MREGMDMPFAGAGRGFRRRVVLIRKGRGGRPGPCSWRILGEFRFDNNSL
jgi:hypothetical protein